MLPALDSRGRERVRWRGPPVAWWRLSLVLVGVLLGAAHGASLGPGKPLLVVCAVEGTVETLRSGATVWDSSRTNQLLYVGDRLRTMVNSRALYRLTEGKDLMRLGPSSELEVRAGTESRWKVVLKRGLFYFFDRDRPGSYDIETPTVSAGSLGTELSVVVADDGATRVSVLDGLVRLRNESGSLLLRTGEQGIAEPASAPVRTAAIVAVKDIQWCLYYPGVLDLEELDLALPERELLRESLTAYAEGDLPTALRLYPAGRQAVSGAEKVYLAALLLGVGEAERARKLLEAVPQSEPRHFALGKVLQRVVDVAQNREVEAQQNSSNSLRSATKLLADSYCFQSRGCLPEALQAAREVVQVSTNFAFGWARVAELEFSFGHLRSARAALERSLALGPRNAQALSLKGFLLAADNRVSEALGWFDKAIAVDGALANAWLGRGLCSIRHGKCDAGRADLQTAAALEPNRSFLRSYLAKAWNLTHDNKLAVKELELAVKLDPQDPTPWFYSALIKQEQNRINEAITDLEKSRLLNDNRQVYRSQFLLDQDQAVRSASLATVYQEAGMSEVSLREASRAVTYDYSDYSSHLFLANSYDALRDPTRVNLRYDTPWFNELLLANLLAPSGVQVISPNISQQEYSRLFEHDRFGLLTTTDLRSDGEYHEVASQYGSSGPLSYSLDLDWRHNEGSRPNNQLTTAEWYSQVKYRLSPQDSVMVLSKYVDYTSGDTFQHSDPTGFLVTTDSLTGKTKTNTNYRPYFKFDETQCPILLGAYHREWSPGMHTLAIGGCLEQDQSIGDQAVSLPIIDLDPRIGQPIKSAFSDFDVAYESHLRAWIGEINQMIQGDRNTLILGGRFQNGGFDTRNAFTNVSIFNRYFPTTDAVAQEDFQSWSIYGYDTVEILPSRLWITGGLCYDSLSYPRQSAEPAFVAGPSSADSFGPKGALVWSPSPVLTLRGAYSRSLGGVSIEESYRIEPSQLAGFNQTYRTIMPDALVGTLTGPTFEMAGLALDLKFDTRTYVGLVAQALSSTANGTRVVYESPNSLSPTYLSSTPQRLDYHEYQASLAVNQLLLEDWTVGASYRFTRAELQWMLPELPSNVLTEAQGTEQADLHVFSFYLLYRHRCGFFARAEANYYRQDNSVRRSNDEGHAIEMALPGDEFPQINLWVGYRFRRNLGDISVGLLNANGTDYRLNPLNYFSELPRERVVAARIRFRF